MSNAIWRALAEFPLRPPPTYHASGRERLREQGCGTPAVRCGWLTSASPSALEVWRVECRLNGTPFVPVGVGPRPASMYLELPIAAHVH